MVCIMAPQGYATMEPTITILGLTPEKTFNLAFKWNFAIASFYAPKHNETETRKSYIYKTNTEKLKF